MTKELSEEVSRSLKEEFERISRLSEECLRLLVDKDFQSLSARLDAEGLHSLSAAAASRSLSEQELTFAELLEQISQAKREKKRANDPPVLFIDSCQIQHLDVIMSAIKWLESNYKIKCPCVKFYPGDVPGAKPGHHLLGSTGEITDDVHISVGGHEKLFYPVSYVAMINTLFHEFHHWYESENQLTRRTRLTPTLYEFPLYMLAGRLLANPALMNDEEKRVEMKAEKDFIRFQETHPIVHSWVLLTRELGNPESELAKNLDAAIAKMKREGLSDGYQVSVETVSYTHLTLPTICSV